MHIAVGRQSARPKTSKQKLKTKRKERLAEVSLHYERIELTPSASEFKDREPLALWCVHVREDHPPDNAKALEWFLLTTLPVQSREDAERMLRWYALRWRIEDWHRVIKSGCRVERLAVRPRWRLISTVGVRVGVSHSSVAEGNCIRREAGWGATGGEVSVRRMTNSIRRDVTASPPAKGRSLKLTGHAGVAAKAMAGGITWLEVERPEGEAQEVGETWEAR